MLCSLITYSRGAAPRNALGQDERFAMTGMPRVHPGPTAQNDSRPGLAQGWTHLPPWLLPLDDLNPECPLRGELWLLPEEDEPSGTSHSLAI
jgi:hypothetical protein